MIQPPDRKPDFVYLELDFWWPEMLSRNNAFVGNPVENIYEMEDERVGWRLKKGLVSHLYIGTFAFEDKIQKVYQKYKYDVWIDRILLDQ